MTASGRTRLQRLQSRHAALKQQRATWLSRWYALAQYIAPEHARFLPSKANDGGEEWGSINNGYATDAAERCAAGLMAGVSSPSRPWFQFETRDPELMKSGAVRQYLYNAQETIREVFLRSNVYTALPVVYHDLAVFGTAAMLVADDVADVVRCYPFPVGSYALGQSHRLVVDSISREFRMTAGQIVDRFGRSAAGRARISRAVLGAYENGAADQWFDVVQVIQPNELYDERYLDASRKRWASCVYEVGADDDSLLEESGFDEFPVVATRWWLTGEDVYGRSPGMKAIGDVRQLQFLEETSARALDKEVDPPMAAPSTIEKKRKDLNAGGITYVDAPQGTQGFTPLYRPSLDYEKLERVIARKEESISRAFYNDLFLMISQDERLQRATAREIVERHEEKMLQLGPVLERLQGELLDPLVTRTYLILNRAGVLPPAPPELQGHEVQIEYISILAQAQKMLSLSGIERGVMFVQNLAQLYPDVADVLKADDAAQKYFDAAGTPPDLVRSPEERLALRKQRQAERQAAQMAQAAPALNQMAQATRQLSDAKASSDNALGQLAAQLQGAPAGVPQPAPGAAA